MRDLHYYESVEAVIEFAQKHVSDDSDINRLLKKLSAETVKRWDAAKRNEKS